MSGFEFSGPRVSKVRTPVLILDGLASTRVRSADLASAPMIT
jgi:hypothetical protein